MSRSKGGRYEREFIQELSLLGIPAERVPLSGGAGGSFKDDVVIPVSLQGFPVTLRAEVKFRNTCDGFTKVLRAWEARDYRPVVISSHRFVLLEDLKLGLSNGASDIPQKLPSQVGRWFDPKETHFLAVRFPVRLWRKKWLVVTSEDSSHALAKMIFTP